MKRHVRLADFVTLATALVACCGLTSSLGAQTPSNNDCSAAIPLVVPLKWTNTTVATSNAVSTVNATASGIMASGLPLIADELPNSACSYNYGVAPADNLFNDVWYTFTPPLTGKWSISTCNTANWDSKLAIYSGTCSAPVAISCNDEGIFCSGFTSNLKAFLLSGNAYLLQVGGHNEIATGSGTFTTAFHTPAIGVNYCGTTPNAVDPVGAVMSASGSRRIFFNNLVLTAGPVPNEPALFFYSDAHTTNPFGFANYEGRKCVLAGGTGVVRMLPPVFGVGNIVTKVVDNTLPYGAQIMVGSQRYFQAWYRSSTDDNNDGIVAGANYSDGYAIMFIP